MARSAFHHQHAFRCSAWCSRSVLLVDDAIEWWKTSERVMEEEGLRRSKRPKGDGQITGRV